MASCNLIPHYGTDNLGHTQAITIDCPNLVNGRSRGLSGIHESGNHLLDGFLSAVFKLKAALFTRSEVFSRLSPPNTLRELSPEFGKGFGVGLQLDN